MINVELYAEVDYKDDRAEDYDYEDYWKLTLERAGESLHIFMLWVIK